MVSGEDKMPPFRSKSQQRWMFSNKPEMAKEWAAETPNIKKLPEKVKKNERHHGSGRG